jgi:hypothetical protein
VLFRSQGLERAGFTGGWLTQLEDPAQQALPGQAAQQTAQR